MINLKLERKREAALIRSLTCDIIRVIFNPDYECLQKPLRRFLDDLVNTIQALEERARELDQ